MTCLTFDLYQYMDNIIESKEIRTIVSIIFAYYLHWNLYYLDRGLIFPCQEDVNFLHTVIIFLTANFSYTLIFRFGPSVYEKLFSNGSWPFLSESSNPYYRWYFIFYVLSTILFYFASFTLLLLIPHSVLVKKNSFHFLQDL